MIKKILLIAALLPAALVSAGDLTVDDLTVSSNAMIRGQLNFYSNTGLVASGGTITTNGGYRIHTFTANGTFQINSGSLTCDVLVVAGGGAGGGGNNNYGGGGGGGGIVSNTITFSPGNYAVTVGEGGAGGTGVGANGGNSTISNIIALGGGGGGHSGYSIENAADGGSGGGGTAHSPGNQALSGSSIQTNAGGTGYGNSGGEISTTVNCGVGGGGSGAQGSPALSDNTGTDGGIGRAFNISGSEVYYGGGGGGGGGAGGAGLGGLGGGGNGHAPWTAGGGGYGFPGTNGFGGGGGGAAGETTSPGGSGGSGVVIVRYPITAFGNVTTMTISSNGINQASASGSNVFMGKVGIGTDSPAEQLHVAGNVQVDGSLKLGGEARTNWPSGAQAQGALMVSNNLSDVTDPAAARDNLGIGSSATNDSSAFLSPTSDGSQLTNITAAQVGAVSTNDGALLSANNLSDVANAGTSRANLGLGSAATNDVEAFLSTSGGEVNGNVNVNGSVSVNPSAGDIPMGVYTNQ